MPDATPPVPASAVTSLLKIANWEGTPQEIYEALTVACSAEDYQDCIKGLKERQIDPQLYINNLDKLIDSLPTEASSHGRCRRALRMTCGEHGILPTCYEVPYKFPQPDWDRPSGGGGFAQVWKLTAEEGGEFAVKILSVNRSDLHSDPHYAAEKKRQYCKEVAISKRVSHENILSIEGISSSIQFSIVSRWMENGKLPTYLRKNPGVDRLNLLVGVSRGLRYLHENGIIHKDLKGDNILVGPNGSPLLIDFGISSITRNAESVNASTPNFVCSIPFCAPEVHVASSLVMNRKVPEKVSFHGRCKSDVYSLSMVIVEVTTGTVPFSGVDWYIIAEKVVKGVRPPKPRQFVAPGITLEVWETAEKCWNAEAAKRPTSTEACDMLTQISNAREDRVPRVRELVPIGRKILSRFRGNSKSPSPA